jgi:hypothetical protein
VLLPLTVLILYQVVPETALPAHVVLQLPPDTVPIATTVVPAGTSAVRVAEVLALVRKATLSHAVLSWVMVYSRVSRLVATYAYVRPYRDCVLLPFTMVSRYQEDPFAVVPAHVVLQLPPETRATATTRVPLSIVASLVELVLGFERIETLSHFAAKVLTASAWAGTIASMAVRVRTRVATRARIDRRARRRPPGGNGAGWGIGCLANAVTEPPW